MCPSRGDAVAAKSGNYGAVAVFELIVQALLLLLPALHVVLAPYTKVEESFNVQAVHDMLVHGTNLAKYDHFQFPGVVPRTFLGAAVLAAASSPFSFLLQVFYGRECDGANTCWLEHKAVLFVVVRCILGFMWSVTTLKLKWAVERELGKTEGLCFILTTLVQFHLPFYSSRPLPNSFAMLLVHLSYSAWLDGRVYRAIFHLSVATAAIRCDLLPLLAVLGLWLLLRRKAMPLTAIACGLLGAVSGACMSLALDSIMWQRLLWPELVVLLFNTVQNQSHKWGTLPVWWYFLSALPKALLAGFPLAFVGALQERRVRPFLVVGLGFVALLSALPHKELRFIFPALPLFNVCTAAAIARAIRNRRKVIYRSSPGLGMCRLTNTSLCQGLLQKLFATAVLLSLAVNAVATAVFAWASSLNYPGGHAMDMLHSMNTAEHGSIPVAFVHIDNLAATTGVSRFGEINPWWTYSKEEGLTIEELQTKPFTHLISEHEAVPTYNRVASVSGFTHVSINRWPSASHPLPFSLNTAPQIYIHTRSASSDSKP